MRCIGKDTRNLYTKPCRARFADRVCGHGDSKDDAAGGIGTTHVPADFGDWTATAEAPVANVQRRFPYIGQWDNK